MRKFILFLFIASGFAITPLPSQAQSNELQLWEKQARNVTIIRDDWGIAHIHGRTDADAVFGMMYSQAEDDFNRVETNFINSMGRLAEAEGEGEIYRDLRMELTFSEGSIGGDIERVNLTQLEAFYGKGPRDRTSRSGSAAFAPSALGR